MILDEIKNENESNLIVKRQRGLLDNDEAADILFNDLPLDSNIKNEPSQGYDYNNYNNNNIHNNKPITDEDGWIDVYKQRSSNSLNSLNYDEYENNNNNNDNNHDNNNSKYDYHQHENFKSTVNFDDVENNKLIKHLTVDNYPKPVVIEMKFEMKSINSYPITNRTTTTTTTTSTKNKTSYLRDQRCFKKNSICRRINSDEPEESKRDIIPIRKIDMDKVLPKESEREITVKINILL